MLLSRLLEGAGIPAEGIIESEIADIVYDSRKSAPQTLFVAIRGANSDGHNYVHSAYNGGCRVFVCEEKRPLPPDAIQIIVADTTIALAKLSASFFDFPAKKLKIIGVTGTKGKTTTSTMIYKVLNEFGHKAGLIGTIGIYIANKSYMTINTTPESYKIQKYFFEMVQNGIEYAVMEVSSQAYLLNRVYGITFDYGVFTNLSQDHIGPGECRDFAHYRDCKAQLFENSRISVINIDDKNSDYFCRRANGSVITYGMGAGADYRGMDDTIWREKHRFGIQFKAVHEGESTLVKSATPGKYSVYNVLAVIAVCHQCGLAIKDIAKVLPSCVIKGRFEVLDALPYCPIIIDFAHNEVSLENVLRTIREYAPKRLVVLFGSVGDRSQLRRAAMARVASELADFAVLTSDDQNYEDPVHILSEIESEMDPDRCPYKVIVNRAEAVEWAVRNCRPGDILLLAGKGHETYELINGVREPFDERKIVEETAALIAAPRN